MKINELIDSHSELTDTAASKSAVVLMTRIRLARNLAGQPFPGWAKDGTMGAKLSNARAETVSEKPAFRARPTPFARRK